MMHLYLRNLLFTILQPGIVAGLIPYYLMHENVNVYIGSGISHFSGILFFLWLNFDIDMYFALHDAWR